MKISNCINQYDLISNNLFYIFEYKNDTDFYKSENRTALNLIWNK
jgi:hypothetical protein